QLKDLLPGKLALPGIELKPLDRWQIVTKLLAVKDAEAEALLAAERQRDTSDDGRKEAYGGAGRRAEAVAKRWAVKDAEAEALLAAERHRDTSDDGRKQAYVAEAARADAVTKQRYF